MRLFHLISVVFYLLVFRGNAQTCENNLPFSTDSNYITIWNGEKYVPFFMKGMHMGVSVPGRFPGELAVSRGQYARWIHQIREAGFNCLRLYTLHFPHFYEVLDSINQANPKHPVYFFQGVWLEEEVPNYDNSITTLTSFFQQEIKENVDCVHGNRTIPQRQGKAYGTYTKNVAKWNMGYIIGREFYPTKLINANLQNPSLTSYDGTHFRINNVTPADVWVTSMLDYLVKYENDNYQTMRPVSASSWPTLDPIPHPNEKFRWEDTAQFNLDKIQLKNADAGLFVSYHAYPYYPDFISEDPNYQNEYDFMGQNSYQGYLKDLKSHYKKFPLIITEYRVPSSWGVAHFAQSGMHHGGFDEKEQGIYFDRLIKNIQNSGYGGGIQFAWMDEWFKKTWITDMMDFDNERRVLWHNITATEQNFGIIGFQRPFNLQNWQNFCASCEVRNVKAFADYDFIHMHVALKQPLNVLDTMRIALDTYASSLGENKLPTGQTIANHAEFLIKITPFEAHLYVTEAYDLFGNWHATAGPEQLFRSVPTNQNKWRLVRWKNNAGHADVQYIGNLKINKGNLPYSSKDAVTVYDDRLEIRLPWTLINFSDPSARKVVHDYRNIPGTQDTLSDGIRATIVHNGFTGITGTRFTRPTWNVVTDYVEYTKASYDIVKQQLVLLNSKAIPFCDSYDIDTQNPVPIAVNTGVLKNDIDLDGNQLQAVITQSAQHGIISLNANGSFVYDVTNGNTGQDQFKYAVFDGVSLSKPVTVTLNIDYPVSIDENKENIKRNSVTLYPVPAQNFVEITSGEDITSNVLMYNNGQVIAEYYPNLQKQKINT